jgi:hypothetical protein
MPANVSFYNVFIRIFREMGLYWENLVKMVVFENIWLIRVSSAYSTPLSSQQFDILITLGATYLFC